MNVAKYSDEFLVRLVRSFLSYPAEPTWFEFKRNCADVMRIGKYLSGLSNAALLANQPFGYLVYGVDNLTHEIVGTSFDPLCEKTKGKNCGEELVNYIQRGLHDSAVSYDVFSVIDKQRILEYICLKQQASAKEIFEAVKSFLPMGRTLIENRRKITSLLSVIMSGREGLIKTARPHTSTWILTQKGVEICRSGNSSCKRRCPSC